MKVELSTARDDDTTQAVYVTLAKAGDCKVAYTKELVKSVVLADYNQYGHIVGVEILDLSFAPPTEH